MDFTRSMSRKTTRTPSPKNEVSIYVSAPSADGRTPSSSVGIDRVNSNLWTVFSPHTEAAHVENPRKQVEYPDPSLTMKNRSRSPEQRLVLVAMRLAVLEKLTTGLGKLSFVWATVVLLGGFVGELTTEDFWTIVALLLTEGTRVFSRSKELEWQQANYSLEIVHISSFLFDKSRTSTPKHSRGERERKLSENLQKSRPKNLYEGYGAKRTWSWGTVPFIPYINFITTKAVSLILYFLQLGSAMAGIGLSIWRLTKNVELGSTSEDNEGNSEYSRVLFYVLMLAEASVFLLERAYWEYKLRISKLLEFVINKCELNPTDLDTLKQYFYTVYSRCLNGSVFDGLDLDLIGFSVQKMQSNFREEQLGSVQILSTLVSKGVSREETRRRIGTTPGVVERLVEMVTWKDMSEMEIRDAATSVLRDLVRHQNNCFRISAIPGSLESLVSLLTEKDEFDKDKVRGLIILKHLARDHRICVRIGNTSGLVHMLVLFIRLRDTTDLASTDTWKVVKKSLQLLKMMASAGGESGHSLRNKIASTVFAVKNLKELLNYEEPKCDLQELAVEILTCLATEDGLRDSIGATGGIISSLLALLTRKTRNFSTEFNVSMKAGEALSLLVLQSPNNCARALDHKPWKLQQEVSKTFSDLLGMIGSPFTGIHAATILTSLCKEFNRREVAEVSTKLPEVINIVHTSSDKEQEAALGLAAAVIPLLDRETFIRHSRSKQNVQLVDKIKELVSASVPARLNRIRRYNVELLNALMVKDKFFVDAFRRDRSVEMHLESMLETASDVENFYTFSGVVGLTRHSRSLQELVNTALSNLYNL